MSLDYRENKRKQIGFAYAFRGIWHAIASEFNLKVQLVIAACVITLGFVFRITFIEWAILILTIGFVLSMELVNTAIEQIMDYLSPEKHRTVGLIKDIAAGAVLCAALTSVVIGLIIFGPKIIKIIF